MRLIAIFDDEKQARDFSAFLSKEKVDNLYEASTNADRGSPDYEKTQYYLWVFDENEVARATEWVQEFREKPEEPKFETKQQPLKHLIEPRISKWKESQERIGRRGQKGHFWKRKTPASLTVYLIVFCSLLFLAMEMNAKRVKKIPSTIPYTVVVSSELKKQMLFDYPYAFDLADNLLVLYGVEALIEPENLPEEGRYLFDEYLRTKWWKGVYHEIVANSDDPETNWKYDGPLFEKVREGEWWRVFTPCLLHGDFFHLLFNMIWLGVLGSQMEVRLKKLKYLLFIIVVAVISNTAQYLMSGFNFLGFSGVVCGMLGFMWMRQRVAPWEGYRLHPTTVAFIAFFVLAMLGLQLISFFLEVSYDMPLPIGIANTAHMTGGITGLFIGRSFTKLTE